MIKLNENNTLSITKLRDCTEISGLKNFSLKDTLDCGQAFRWKEENGLWHCIADGKYVYAKQLNSDSFRLYGTTEDEFYSFWFPYFDLSRDYGKISAELSRDPVIGKAIELYGGIRVLRQPKWETLCSFIISQNNNIPRIKGIIERLCENFGKKTEHGYTFPQPEKLAVLSPEDLACIRSGFRAKYIIDAAKKTVDGTVNFDLIDSLPTDAAERELMKITGVGPKVADCTLLFAFGKIDAFPKDVWIKRAMEKLFGGELPECAKPYAGIAQQFIFQYARQTKLEI